MYDLIIIGAGPAGMSAAIYASRAKLNTFVIEQNYVSGGQIVDTYEIDNYPGLPGLSGMDLAQKMSDHAAQFGIEPFTATVEGLSAAGPIKVVKTDEGDFEARAVIIASGATHMKLGVEGEDQFAGMGVSYCATCDGAFYRGKDVMVVGGGNVAVEDAIFLARGSRKVYVVHRRDELRAAKILQESLFALPNVEMVWNSNLKRIEGDGKVTGAVVVNKLSGEETEIPVDGVFIAVGIAPRSGFAADGEAGPDVIAADENGYLIAGEDCATSIPGIFAAGDVRTKQLRQVVTAVADGANAVTSAERYLLSRK